MNTINSANSRTEKIADVPFYTEGPAIDSKKNIYVTTLSGKSIIKIDVQGKMSEWARSECPNGQVILPNDEHLICDSKLAAIRRFGSNGVFMKDEVKEFCAGHKISVPNDLVVSSKGDIYFTDSVRYTGAVYFIGSDGRQKRIATNLDYPNGLALSGDESFLFVAESYKNRVVKIRLECPDGQEKYSGVFNLPQHPLGDARYNLPDGLVLDDDGNLWVAHHGMHAVHRLSSDGDLLSSVKVPMPLASNLAFVDRGTIVVTGGYNEPGPGIVCNIYL